MENNPVAVAIPINADAARSQSSANTPSADAEGRVRLRDPGLGIGDEDDPQFTLQAAQPHAVAIRTAQTSSNGCGLNEEGLAYTVDSAEGQAIAYGMMPQNSGRDFVAKETQIAQPLVTSGNAPSNQGGDVLVESGTVVRRLTARECERLQGFPDDFTLVMHNGKPMSDSQRYRQMGNAVSVNTVRWIAERIASQSLRKEGSDE